MTDASDPLFRIVQDADECVIALEPVVAQNAGQAARLRSELKSLMDKGGYRQLTVDCDAMDYLPGSVLGILAGFYGKGPEIRLVNASEEIMSLMQTSRLDQKLRFSASRPVRSLAEFLTALQPRQVHSPDDKARALIRSAPGKERMILAS